MNWRAATLIWIARLTGLGLTVYFLAPLGRLFEQLLGYVRPQVSQSMRAWRPSDVFGWLDFLLESLPTIVLFLLGLHLLLGGRWLIRRMLHGLDGTCPACGHPLPDEGPRCTECGFR